MTDNQVLAAIDALANKLLWRFQGIDTKLATLDRRVKDLEDGAMYKAALYEYTGTATCGEAAGDFAGTISAE